ncbi:hypothetical protein AXG93_857s1460 [Marchantia polymorpha subsp. ruderalis]|uniref:Uncharacterized protein n=1 Tax=Marchantia polymorpha subsp. ruderalis TaxID=1480154 RepID=A0A176WER4_MARPO|nr:hypothetical protein AXG93_857s1460 [Marchantia polymorpha subsp. ruderalis]
MRFFLKVESITAPVSKESGVLRVCPKGLDLLIIGACVMYTDMSTVRKKREKKEELGDEGHAAALVSPSHFGEPTPRSRPAAVPYARVSPKIRAIKRATMITPVRRAQSRNVAARRHKLLKKASRFVWFDCVPTRGAAARAAAAAAVGALEAVGVRWTLQHIETTSIFRADRCLGGDKVQVAGREWAASSKASSCRFICF